MLKKFKYLGDSPMKVDKQIVNKKGDIVEVEINEKKKFNHKLFESVEGSKKREDK